jgi:hypothetical protein
MDRDDSKNDDKGPWLDMAGSILARKLELATLRGRDAVIFYLVHKYHWTLDFARGLSDDDLEFLTDHVRGEPVDK